MAQARSEADAALHHEAARNEEPPVYGIPEGANPNFPSRGAAPEPAGQSGAELVNDSNDPGRTLNSSGEASGIAEEDPKPTTDPAGYPSYPRSHPTVPLTRPGARRRARKDAAAAVALATRRLPRRELLLAAGAGSLLVGATGGVLLRDAGSTSTDVGPTMSGGRIGQPAPSGGNQKATLRGTVLALPKSLDPQLLLRRVTYGTTPELAGQVAQTGLQSWLSSQLEAERVSDPEGNDVARRFPRLEWSTATARAKLPSGDPQLMIDLRAAHLGRAIWSRRQLFEIMVDFWSNHLNIPSPSDAVWDTRHRYDADVIRRHALGRFEDMLLASATHPAMLVHLDGAESNGEEPNENYARELLELHTVGITGEYSERDVRRAALLLTGWTVYRGEARFDPDRHYTGAVRVLEYSSANKTPDGGRAAITGLLRYLARHPKTAERIARKLAVRFVSDDPPDSLVAALAEVYLAHETATVPVLRALFSSEEFAASAGEKIRRPMERLAATIRVLGVPLGPESKAILDLVQSLEAAGHPPLGSPSPGGYPDTATAWQSPASALTQFNDTAALVRGWWPSTLVLPGPAQLLTDPPTDRDGLVDALARRLLGRPPTGREQSAARTLLDGTRIPGSVTAGSTPQTEAIALVATLLLSSPAHFLR